jgi:hypothetical protein
VPVTPGEGRLERVIAGSEQCSHGYWKTCDPVDDPFGAGGDP